MDPSISTEEAAAVVETKTEPRVTVDSIKARIADSTYVHSGTLTICILTMTNGFKVIGKAAPASPKNFDPEVGHRYAYDDAFRQLWPLEGYLLCEQLHGPK